MNTFIYMVRHGDSPKEGNERTRGLTEKGLLDAERITALLKEEDIDAVISSPYLRSILTVDQIGQEVAVVEDFKERIFSSGDHRISDKELGPLLDRTRLRFKRWRIKCCMSRKSHKRTKRISKYS
jgi:2,3-bisphosphoglycerate-dependent phosphoglycerate mutase